LFQNFFYFWALNIVVGVVCLSNFHISVPEELYDWLVEERKKRKASSVQDVIRQILKEVKEEAEKHG
jgi:hypothetical protein